MTDDLDGPLGMDTSYNLFVKPESSRRLEHINWAASTRGDFTLQPGVSTPNVLRFYPVKFTSAGTYKVCFCDSKRGSCSKLEDFGYEVGTVHVSGISCLLDVPKLRRKQCYEQYYGGLSCADEWTMAS